MIISVASGKGGTGKTTVSTNLALSVGKVQFLDCDVEEPNANFFIKANLQKRENVAVRIPKIEKKKCTYCGRCAEFCAYNALAVVNKEVLVFPELCHSCEGCGMICPEDAISWSERVIGQVESGTSDGIAFSHGLLNVGEMQAIPVIKALKKKIDTNRHVILDVPPGTSCPVIESVLGSDYCVLVTEPTPFGFHDLKLAIEVIRHLHIPFGVIINRDGIGDATVEQYCAKEKVPILLKIPERKKIAHLYSEGTALVNASYEWHEMFGQVFTQIAEAISA